jgi:uncharacterized protein with GYD domain
MPMFICSLNWTDQGIRSVKDAPKRAQAAQDLAKKVGVEIKEVYLTSGDDDLLVRLRAVGVSIFRKTENASARSVAETETQPQEPANCGLLGCLRENCRFERLRGGPGRTRTSNQTVMSRRL